MLVLRTSTSVGAIIIAWHFARVLHACIRIFSRSLLAECGCVHVHVHPTVKCNMACSYTVFLAVALKAGVSGDALRSLVTGACGGGGCVA